VEPLESVRVTTKCSSLLLPPLSQPWSLLSSQDPQNPSDPEGLPVPTHTHERGPVLEPPVSNTLFMFLSREIQAGWLRFVRLVVRVSSVVALHPL
jgi:hypothetical protein